MNDNRMNSQELLSKYFSGNASQEEISEVDQWFHTSEENKIEFMQYKEAWDLSNAEQFDESAAWKKVSEKVLTRTVDLKEEQSSPKIEKKEPKFNYLKIAASFTLLMVASLAVFYFLKNFNADFTKNSQISQVIDKVDQDVLLADGSKLFLAKKGQLTYKSDFSKDGERKVKLKGRAFFEISKNKEKPFVIETNNAKIVVTGTSFLVNEKEGYTEVIVNSGSVRLMRNDKQTYITLKKGDIGEVSKDHKGLIKRKNKDSNYLSWMTGSFNFNSTPLKEVFALLEDKYEVNIELQNQGLGNCKLFSQFENRPIDEIMSIIEIALNVQIKKKGNDFFVNGKSCKK